MNTDLYKDRGARLDTVVGDGKAYWSMLSRIAEQLVGDKNKNFLPKDAFAKWCEVEHGFRPVYDEDGGITGEPVITDPQKYTVCLLKYGG